MFFRRECNASTVWTVIHIVLLQFQKIMFKDFTRLKQISFALYLPEIHIHYFYKSIPVYMPRPLHNRHIIILSVGKNWSLFKFIHPSFDPPFSQKINIVWYRQHVSRRKLYRYPHLRFQAHFCIKCYGTWTEIRTETRIRYRLFLSRSLNGNWYQSPHSTF